MDKNTRNAIIAVVVILAPAVYLGIVAFDDFAALVAAMFGAS